jgi:hypothetical protein
MHLRALTHLARITRAISEQQSVVVFGSSSLLAVHPDLGEPGGPLEVSLDADFLVTNCDDMLAQALDEAIGDDSLFQERAGYHADFLRPAIADQLPADWRDRLNPLPGCEGVFCIEPHDLAVAKLQAGRPKDLDLLTELVRRGLIDPGIVRERLAATRLRESLIVRTHANLKEIARRASSPPGG